MKAEPSKWNISMNRSLAKASRSKDTLRLAEAEEWTWLSSSGHGLGCVEELRNHRNQPLGTVHERDMSRAGEHRELGTWETDEVACHAAAEQAKQLYCVLRTDEIGIPR